jgi:hypothetical protein
LAFQRHPHVLAPATRRIGRRPRPSAAAGRVDGLAADGGPGEVGAAFRPAAARAVRTAVGDGEASFAPLSDGPNRNHSGYPNRDNTYECPPAIRNIEGDFPYDPIASCHEPCYKGRVCWIFAKGCIHSTEHDRFPVRLDAAWSRGHLVECLQQPRHRRGRRRYALRSPSPRRHGRLFPPGLIGPAMVTKIEKGVAMTHLPAPRVATLGAIPPGRTSGSTEHRDAELVDQIKAYVELSPAPRA